MCGLQRRSYERDRHSVEKETVFGRVLENENKNPDKDENVDPRRVSSKCKSKRCGAEHSQGGHVVRFHPAAGSSQGQLQALERGYLLTWSCRGHCLLTDLMCIHPPFLPCPQSSESVGRLFLHQPSQQSPSDFAVLAPWLVFDLK